MTITILDCGHGNIASVANALNHLGRDTLATSDPSAVGRATCIIIPGQGAAPAAMKTLRDSGLYDALLEARRGAVPTLGICLGMQLALTRSEEGPTECLGLVAGDCKLFPADRKLKLPHMGWNTVEFQGTNPLFAGIPSGSYFYFVHSFYCDVPSSYRLTETEYGLRFASALHNHSLWATQFHPEKSGEAGLQLLNNFLEMAGC